MQTSWGQTQELTVAESSSEVRTSFIRKTYIHLALALLAFAGIEFALLTTEIGNAITKGIFGLMGGKMNAMIMLVAFMGVSYLANAWANSNTSKALQYLGLGLYVTFQAIIVLPLIVFAIAKTGDTSLIQQAGLLTAALFCGLTAICFFSGANFSFLGPFLCVAGFLGIGFIACSILFGFNLGVGFSYIMAAVAAGYIIYSTSNMMHVYNPNQHVAAALALFASVILLFVHILRILANNRN